MNDIAYVAWLTCIAEAQQLTHVRSGSLVFARIPYGSEPLPANPADCCADCGVALGGLHVPDACSFERCPVCGSQAISCGCLTRVEWVGGVA